MIRNLLVTNAVNTIIDLYPEYVLLENVPEQLTTSILYNNENMLIPEYIKTILGDNYYFSKEHIVNAADFGVPQHRERAIILLTRKDKNIVWELPKKKMKHRTMKDAIGHLPTLDPLISDIDYFDMLKIFPNYEENKKNAESISKWHTPPSHVYRQVFAMQHTKTGKSAFENIDMYKPKKVDGTIVRGFKNTYKRQHWDNPAYTITMYNRTIGSQNNVHPGRYIGIDTDGSEIYSDPRVLTVYEIMLIMSIPEDWNIPNWVSDSFIRSVIGEGIPPLLIKKIMEELPNRVKSPLL